MSILKEFQEFLKERVSKYNFGDHASMAGLGALCLLLITAVIAGVVVLLTQAPGFVLFCVACLVPTFYHIVVEVFSY